MKLACADDTVRPLEHDGIIELIRLLGLEGVDVCLMEGRSSLRLDDVRADARGAAATIDERVRKRGLEVADVFVARPGATTRHAQSRRQDDFAH
jgi:hypothetical protein